MVKVQKYSKEKKKANGEKYRDEIKKQRYGILPNVAYAMRECYRADKVFVLCCFMFAAAMFAHRLCLVYIDKYVVELAAAGFDKGLLMTCAVLFLLKEVCDYASVWAQRYQGYIGNMKARNHFSRLIMKKCITTDYENKERCETNNSLNQALEGSNVAAYNTPINLRGSIRHILEFFTYSAILSMLSPWLIPIVVVPAALSYYINRHKMNWIWNMSDNWQVYERQLTYIKNTGCDLARAKDVRLFTLPILLGKAFSRAFKNRLEWYEQQDAWEFRHEVFQTLVLAVGKFASYAYVIYLVINGEIGAGDFVLYFNSIMKLSEATRDWFDNFSGYQWICNNINYVRNYLEMPEKTNRGEGRPLPKGSFEIEFRNVSYTYNGAEEPTIKNLSFKIKKGERLALVGLNGAGKTTVVKLLCGLYDPTEGEILVDGFPVNEYNREEYFTLFSAVFQDISVFAGEVAENVTGRGNYDGDRLFRCMKNAGIYEKIQSLPQKEHTHLVRGTYEDAIDLSGGETQKLALAKALYKNSQMLILDEPTAALDPIAEQEMYLNYTKFAEGKSSLFISHRLASTRFCDRIILLADGGVAECGTHSELMELGGKYAELFELQSSYYNDEKVQKEEDL
ncbi:MAG: ABC transporter ATP-binding protein/permease [Ruminococcus sp.]|nr:ABC transporter ATP-binding protein/permease [Ruminococcus sp.]MCM1381774.1 ABC transporter ATP-binding protein/permease [Muribaculaceae bacterium]MCM1480685.1 ABC transporter ATP-binding protein/permease [Muribaculaceae bacterium]